MNLDDQELSSLIKQHATRHAASDGLRAGIGTQLALAEAGRTPATPTPPRRFSFGWRSAAIGFAFGIVCSTFVLPLAQHLDFARPLESELVAEHVRALKIGPLVAVASSDHHTVKPWFQGRLDYAPPVIDLGAEGFPLSGGRVEQLRGNAVAVLAYTHNAHVIEVFVWPGEAVEALHLSVQRGS